MPRVLEVFVEADLLGGHRFDLDHLVDALRADQFGDDPVGLLGVGGPVHDAAAGGHVGLELLQQLRQVRAITSRLDRRRRRRATASQSGISSTTSARLARIDRGGVGQVAAQLVVRQLLAGRLRERLGAAQRRCPSCRGVPSCGMPRNGAHAGIAPRSRPGSAPGGRSRCRCRRRDRPPPMFIRQDASPAVHTLGAGAHDVGDLVGEHRRRGVGVLDREGAAEAAALVGPGQLDQVDALAPRAAAAAACRRPAASAASGRWGGR